MARSPDPRPAGRLGGLAAPTLVRHLGAAVLAGVVLLIGSNTIGDYRDYQLANVAVYVVAVAGLTLLIGLSGQISIGNGAFMAVGGYLAALLLADLKWPLIAILLAATAGAAVVGAIFGVAAARLRGPYLAGATLMLAVALPSVATRFQSVLGGDQGLGFFIGVPGFLGPNVSPYRWLAWVTCGAALVTMVLLANLIRSRTGRSWRAVRDDEIAAALAGLNVARLQILAFVVSAACAGLGGTLLAMWNQSVSPGLFSLTLSIQLLTAAVLGGLGSLTGAVLGSAIVVLPYTYLQNQAISLGMTTATGSNVPILAYGAVLIVVMLAFPAGIQGLLAWMVRASRVRQAVRWLTGPLARRASPGPSVHSAASGHPDQRSAPAAEPQEKGTT
ncbi:MAG TPA: branched-chain amino acid ABC transporter permease [Streptosporangiaceae bacterium]|nr:branched-chain amino acid ABC transporter permease [Streptosporangiaceae bacterium]